MLRAIMTVSVSGRLMMAMHPLCRIHCRFTTNLFSCMRHRDPSLQFLCALNEHNIAPCFFMIHPIYL